MCFFKNIMLSNFKWNDYILKKLLLTLAIVDTNRRTRAATCRKMIPSSKSSIFSDDLDSNEKRRQWVCECVWMSHWWDMGVSLQHVQHAEHLDELHLDLSLSDGRVHIYTAERDCSYSTPGKNVSKFGLHFTDCLSTSNLLMIIINDIRTNTNL